MNQIKKLLVTNYFGDSDILITNYTKEELSKNSKINIWSPDEGEKVVEVRKCDYEDNYIEYRNLKQTNIANEENKLLKSFVKEYKEPLDKLGKDYDINFDDIESVKDFSYGFYSDTLTRMPSDEKVIKKMDIAAYASSLELEDHISLNEYNKIKQKYNLSSLDKYFENEEKERAEDKKKQLKEFKKTIKVNDKKNFKAKQKL